MNCFRFKIALELLISVVYAIALIGGWYVFGGAILQAVVCDFGSGEVVNWDELNDITTVALVERNLGIGRLGQLIVLVAVVFPLFLNLYITFKVRRRVIDEHLKAKTPEHGSGD